MATAVKKSAKLNFYKFVPPLKVSGGKGDAKDAALQNGIGKNTQAINNIGATLNSLGKVLIEFRDSQVKMIGEIQASAKDTFKPIYSKPTGGPDMGELEGGEMPETEMPSWLESLFNIVKDFLILALAGPALEWLSDEKNREAIKSTIETILKVVEFVSNFIGDRVKGLIDSLHDLFFNKEQNWWEKLGSFFSAFVNFAGLFLAIRWLTNPMNIVKDFKSVLGLFVKNLKKSRGKLARRAKALGAVAAVATLATIVVTSMNDNGGDEDKDPPEKAKGGPLPLKAGGGWINGPMSGYPVSLDGGKSTSFIGHGLEYVAQKANGGFVVPFNTPATRNNSGLTDRRIGEASRMGFDLGGMFDSMPKFDIGGSLPELPEFAAGGALTGNAAKWAEFYNYGKKAGAKYPELVSAQFALESGWGSALSAKNNFFGIKALDSESGQVHMTREVKNGRSVMEPHKFKNFNTPQDAVNHLVNQWYKDFKGYKGVNRMNDPIHGAALLKAEGYATDPIYAQSLQRILRDNKSTTEKVKGGNVTYPPGDYTSPTGGADSPAGPVNADGSAVTMSKPFNFGEGIREMVKNLMGTFGGSDAATTATNGERASATESGTAPANQRAAADVSNANQESKSKVTPPPLPPVTPASTPSTQKVAETTETVATAKRDRRTAQAQMLRNLQQQNQAQRQRIAALSQASQKAVADAQNAENSKQPTIAGGATTTASLIDRMQSGNSLLKT